MFASWILQNYLQTSWAGEKEYLDKTQILISIEEGHMNEWLTFLLQERGKQNPDSMILGQCALKYIQYSANILTWTTARVTDQSNNQLGLLAEKQKLFTRVIDRYKQGNFASLISLADSITESQNRLGPDLIQKFEDNYVEVVQREENSNRWFFWAYTIGSLLIGIDFIKDKIKP